MSRLLFAGFLLIIFSQGYSQQPGLYPLPFVKFTDNYSFDNPASASFSEYWEIKMVNSFYTGLLNNVGFYYLDATIHSGQKNSGRHSPGLMIYSEYETEILKRTRAYARYAWSTPISSTLSLAAGIHAGFFNYSVKATNSSAGASATIPDATAGLWLKSNKMNIGIASAQLTGAEIKPVNKIFILSRYFILTSDYKLRISQSMDLLLAGKAWKGQGDNEGLHMASKLFITKNFSAEINYLLKKGAGFSLGILQFPVIKIHGNLYFSYFQPSGRINPFNAQRFEIYLKFNK